MGNAAGAAGKFEAPPLTQGKRRRVGWAGREREKRKEGAGQNAIRRDGGRARLTLMRDMDPRYLFTSFVTTMAASSIFSMPSSRLSSRVASLSLLFLPILANEALQHFRFEVGSQIWKSSEKARA